MKRFQKGLLVAALSAIVVVASIMVLTVCPSVTSVPRQPVGGIVTGDAVQVTVKTIPLSGGSVLVDKPGHPLHGFRIEVPDRAFDSRREFNVSSAPIKSHTFGKDFNPVSPLVTVENGGEYSDKPLVVTIPV